ncbi:thioesterase II family protein [Streptomyces chartreusis]|uniref:thioesterase II family protein n=1 Tax=Streptomyces chartreusis TaxID=1969 RepID=UPI0033C7687C
MTGQAQDDDRRWLKRFGRRDDPAGTQLLCFHHAGGSAAMFRQWARELPRSVQPIAVQLPGRADRFHEPAHERMDPLVDDLIEVVKPLLDRPFALYGVSMGARVAWALAHALRERAMPRPRMLFVAACAGPELDHAGRDWEGRWDDLEGYLRDLGGTPAEVLNEPELLRVLLPTLRADLTLLSTHDFEPAVPLDLPVHAFAGSADLTATPHRMRAWQSATTGRFDLDIVPGGHFFDLDGEQQVIRTVAQHLA